MTNETTDINNDFGKSVVTSRKRISRVSGVLTIFLFVILILLGNADQNLISANLDPILKEFGFGVNNPLPISYITGTFTILSGISMVFFGISSDRYSRKWILFFGSLIYSTFSALAYLTPLGKAGYPILFIIRAMNGIAIGSIVPTIYSLIGDLVGPNDRSKAFSWFSVAGLLGSAFGPAIASGIYLSTGSWRLPFLFVGATNAICTLFILPLKEPMRGQTEEYIEKTVGEGKEYSYTINRRDFKGIFQRKSNFWLIINFVDTIPTGIIVFLVFLYMENVHGVNQGMTTVFLIFAVLGGVVGTVFFGALADHYYKKGMKKIRVKFAFWGNLAPIPFILGAFLIPFSVSAGTSFGAMFKIPQVLLFVMLLTLGLFVNGMVGANWYSTLMDVNLPEHRGTTIASANFFDLLGRALGPILGSFFYATFGPEMGILSSVFFWAVLPLFWIGVLKNVEKDMDFVKKTLKERSILMEQTNKSNNNGTEHQEGTGK